MAGSALEREVGCRCVRRGLEELWTEVAILWARWQEMVVRDASKHEMV